MLVGRQLALRYSLMRPVTAWWRSIRIGGNGTMGSNRAADADRAGPWAAAGRPPPDGEGPLRGSVALWGVQYEDRHAEESCRFRAGTSLTALKLPCLHSGLPDTDRAVAHGDRPGARGDAARSRRSGSAATPPDGEPQTGLPTGRRTGHQTGTPNQPRGASPPRSPPRVCPRSDCRQSSSPSRLPAATGEVDRRRAAGATGRHETDKQGYCQQTHRTSHTALTSSWANRFPLHGVRELLLKCARCRVCPDTVDQHGQRFARGGVLGGDPVGERAHLVERAEVGGQEPRGVCRIHRVDPVDRLGAPVAVASDHGDPTEMAERASTHLPPPDNTAHSFRATHNVDYS
ncbi:hypothetical protein P3T29_004804 [Kitasatospora sp. MAP5-34]|nr:hypothetical protein [Kitasatospora sp. MAP5-34]